LGRVTQSSKDWLSPDNRNLWVVHSLLEQGASGGKAANLAFLSAVRAYLGRASSEALVETFLTVGLADVNFESGTALKMAVGAGEIRFLGTLLSRGANEQTLACAFYEAATAELGEETALALIDVLARGNKTVPGFKAAIPSLGPLIRDCLASHPESPKLVRRLVDLGCKPDQTIQAQLYYDCVPEPCTPLLWALCPSTESWRPVSSTALEALIKAKGV
jgi:hypothetical protein